MILLYFFLTHSPSDNGILGVGVVPNPIGAGWMPGNFPIGGNPRRNHFSSICGCAFAGNGFPMPHGR